MLLGFSQLVLQLFDLRFQTLIAAVQTFIAAVQLL